MRFALTILGVEFFRVEFGPELHAQGEFVHNAGGLFEMHHEDPEPDEDDYAFGFAT